MTVPDQHTSCGEKIRLPRSPLHPPPPHTHTLRHWNKGMYLDQHTWAVGQRYVHHPEHIGTLRQRYVTSTLEHEDVPHQNTRTLRQMYAPPPPVPHQHTGTLRQRYVSYQHTGAWDRGTSAYRDTWTTVRLLSMHFGIQCRNLPIHWGIGTVMSVINTE